LLLIYIYIYNYLFQILFKFLADYVNFLDLYAVLTIVNGIDVALAILI